MRRAIILCCAISLCILCTEACGKRRVQIDRHTRTSIDTIAARMVNDLRPEIDSLCASQMDSLVLALRDSILDVRRSEMRKLLGK